MSAPVGGLDGRPQKQQQTPQQILRGTAPTYDLLSKVYHLRTRSVLAWLGFLVLLAGVFFAGISLALLLTMKQPFLGIDFVALTSGWLVPGILLFVGGIVLLILDFMKRKLICPYPFEVLNDFLHGMCQERVFPSKGMSKNQFKFKIKKHGGTYCIDFNLDAPGCSYEELRPHMRRIAEGLGCADTYNFTEQTGRASRYAKGYRYRFEIVLLSAEKAFAKAGEYRGK